VREEFGGPGLDLPWHLAAERLGAGQQRRADVHEPATLPMKRQRGAQRRALAAAVKPGGYPERGAEERRRGPAYRQPRGGLLDRLRLAGVGPREPPPQRERMARRLEDRAALDHRRGAVHAKAHPFDHRGEMPGVDRASVAGGVTADRLEPSAPQPGRYQRVAGGERIEPGNRRGGLFERTGKPGESVQGPGRYLLRLAAGCGTAAGRQRHHRGRASGRNAPASWQWATAAGFAKRPP
jgi:hypothetical protein